MTAFPRKILVTVLYKPIETEIWEKHKLLYECTNHTLKIDLDVINDERMYIVNIEFIY